jgi:hypothetical protein
MNTRVVGSTVQRFNGWEKHEERFTVQWFNGWENMKIERFEDIPRNNSKTPTNRPGARVQPSVDSSTTSRNIKRVR